MSHMLMLMFHFPDKSVGELDERTFHMQKNGRLENNCKNGESRVFQKMSPEDILAIFTAERCPKSIFFLKEGKTIIDLDFHKELAMGGGKFNWPKGLVARSSNGKVVKIPPGALFDGQAFLYYEHKLDATAGQYLLYPCSWDLSETGHRVGPASKRKLKQMMGNGR